MNAMTVKDMVTVKSLTKYGFQTSTGEYINWSKQLLESEKGCIVPNSVYEVELYVSESGKRYLNHVLNTSSVIKITEKPKVLNMATEIGNFDKPMTRADWEAKDKRISRQGVIQAAVQAVAPLVAVENVFKEAVLLADQMLEYVNKV